MITFTEKDDVLAMDFKKIRLTNEKKPTKTTI